MITPDAFTGNARAFPVWRRQFEAYAYMYSYGHILRHHTDQYKVDGSEMTPYVDPYEPSTKVKAESGYKNGNQIQP